MNSSFALTQGAGQKLEFAVQRNDGTTEDIDFLSTGENFRTVTLLRTGKAKLVEITEAGEGAVIATAGTPTKWSVDTDGNIHFTLTSNGRTGEEWIAYFENEKRDGNKKYRVSDWGKSVLRNTSNPTNGVTYHIVVRPGAKIGASDRITKKIRKAAEDKGWKKPHWEVGPLIRDAFTDKELEEMGVWYIVAMHEPIKDADGDPFVLYSRRDGGGRWLDADCEKPDDGWDGRGGFAFEAPQEQSTKVSEPKA